MEKSQETLSVLPEYHHACCGVTDNLPPWLHLCDDYDRELVRAQMAVKDTANGGFLPWAIIDPGEILDGKNPGDACRAMREREERVLLRSLGHKVEEPPEQSCESLSLREQADLYSFMLCQKF